MRAYTEDEIAISDVIRMLAPALIHGQGMRAAIIERELEAVLEAFMRRCRTPAPPSSETVKDMEG